MKPSVPKPLEFKLLGLIAGLALLGFWRYNPERLGLILAWGFGMLMLDA